MKQPPDYSKSPPASLRRMGRYIPSQNKHPIFKSFCWTERKLEAVLAWLQSLAFLKILGIISNIGILIAICTYIGSEKQRRDDEVLNAWQTITSAHGQPGSGGRIQALEFLNASPGANWRRRFPWFCAPHPLCTWSPKSLDGINISVETEDFQQPPHNTGPRVYLRGIVLPQASLRDADLERADLRNANLKWAFLERAILAGAILQEANLKQADLQEAQLEGAFLGGANLEAANLSKANLQGAFLERANLAGANLKATNLTEGFLLAANLARADLKGANLAGASLGQVNLQGADLRGANLSKTKGVNAESLTQALLCRTVFPEDIPLNPNRDCEELGIAPRRL